jgi:hypothetical protein
MPGGHDRGLVTVPVLYLMFVRLTTLSASMPAMWVPHAGIDDRVMRM